MAPQAALDLDVLLAHEHWARRLARALLRDPDAAEDVMQEARLSFWRKGPDDPARARSWLGQVVRNLVRTQARRQRRQEARASEQQRDENSQSPSAEDLAERLEAHRLLATLVGELREPFREVVLLRYYEGKSAADIARLLNIPAGTVRWRVKTGLDDLRARLDERHGGRRQAWLVLLGGLAGSEGAAGAGASPLAMRLMAGGSVAGTALLIVWLATSPRGGAPAAPDAAAPVQAAAETEGATGQQRLPPPALVVASGGGDPSGTGEPSLPAWAIAPAFPPRVIAGRVTGGGQALPGASLRLSAGMLTHARSLDRHTVADAEGRFAFPAQPATNWFLTASAADRAPQILYVDLRSTNPRVKPRMDPPDDLMIELGPCEVYASGKVHDVGGGVIAGARVKVTQFWNNGGTVERTDAGGHYRICVPRGDGKLTLVAEADGYGTVETLGKLDGVREIDFVLEPGASVDGRTMRQADGTPVAGVKVTLTPGGSANPNNPPVLGTQPVRLETETDEQGRFQVQGLAPGSYGVGLAAGELIAADRDLAVELAAGERLRDLELPLVESALVEGVALRGGKPAPDVMLTFKVQGIPFVPPPRANRWPMAITGPDGRFQRRFKRGTVVERILGPWPGHKAPPGFIVDRPKLSGLVVELP